MKRVILSGGGTGGHIYPAVSVAEALKKRLGDDVEILFVGAEINVMLWDGSLKKVWGRFMEEVRKKRE